MTTAWTKDYFRCCLPNALNSPRKNWRCSDCRKWCSEPPRFLSEIVSFIGSEERKHPSCSTVMVCCRKAAKILMRIKFYSRQKKLHTLKQTMGMERMSFWVCPKKYWIRKWCNQWRKMRDCFRALRIPDPEKVYEEVASARQDIIIIPAIRLSQSGKQCTWISVHFRGALDVRATQINEAMKLAANAFAELAKRTCTGNCQYCIRQQKNMTFGMEYIIPKPLDPRLINTVAPAVAKAAMDSGVAQVTDQQLE